ncbi:hypothetical protein FACS1894145_4460 [Bacteroidia bacterium]|nr:hypothetical protein FACS1894145_4460 [Bacteroidia bacterium]
MSNELQDYAVVKQYYKTNKKDWEKVLYEINVNGDDIVGITEETAIAIHKELGKFLFPEEGVES